MVGAGGDCFGGNGVGIFTGKIQIKSKLEIEN